MPRPGHLRGDNERLLDALLAGVVMHPALALARQTLARAIRRCRRRRAPDAALYGLDAEVVARHALYPRRRPERATGAAPATPRVRPQRTGEAVQRCGVGARGFWFACRPSSGWADKPKGGSGGGIPPDAKSLRTLSSSSSAEWAAAGGDPDRAVCRTSTARQTRFGTEPHGPTFRSHRADKIANRPGISRMPWLLWRRVSPVRNPTAQVGLRGFGRGGAVSHSNAPCSIGGGRRRRGLCPGETARKSRNERSECRVCISAPFNLKSFHGSSGSNVARHPPPRNPSS